MPQNEGANWIPPEDGGLLLLSVKKLVVYQPEGCKYRGFELLYPIPMGFVGLLRKADCESTVIEICEERSATQIFSNEVGLIDEVIEAVKIKMTGKRMVVDRSQFWS